MTNTIFDLLEDEIPEGKEGYFEIAKRAPEPKDNSFFNTIKDYGKTILKGGIEGISKLGTIMGPLPHPQGKSIEQQLEEQSETLDTLLPTEEGFTKRGIRRGLKEAPSIIANPFSGPLQSLSRTMIAGFLGEGAKELGAPEWAQSAAELTAFIGPDITKKLLSKGKDKEIIDFAKKMGMTDEQITPLIQSDFKQKWLSKLSPRRGSTEKALQETKKGISDVYSTIQNSPEAKNFLPKNATFDLLNELSIRAKNMPAGVRKKLKDDAQDLVSSPITGESLINFYADINHYLGENAKQLSLFKKPVKDAINKISPKLGEDFEMVNKLYTKYHPIASKLKPTITSDLISAAESIGILGSLTTGYYPTLVSLLGEKAAKKLSQQLLINPRFQQLSHKMVDAMNQNKYVIVKKLSDSFSSQLKKEFPEISSELDKITEQDIEDLLKGHQRKEE